MWASWSAADHRFEQKQVVCRDDSVAIQIAFDTRWAHRVKNGRQGSEPTRNRGISRRDAGHQTCVVNGDKSRITARESELGRFGYVQGRPIAERSGDSDPLLLAHVAESNPRLLEFDGRRRRARLNVNADRRGKDYRLVCDQSDRKQIPGANNVGRHVQTKRIRRRELINRRAQVLGRDFHPSTGPEAVAVTSIVVPGAWTDPLAGLVMATCCPLAT